MAQASRGSRSRSRRGRRRSRKRGRAPGESAAPLDDPGTPLADPATPLVKPGTSARELLTSAGKPGTPAGAVDTSLDGDGRPSRKVSSTRPARPRARARPHARAPGSGFRDPLSVGERPAAPWHPWPLSEMLILVGAVGVVFGLKRLGHGGIANGGPVLAAGLGAVILGTIEITWREHRAGYRSHALLLAVLPVVVLHSAVVLSIAAITPVPRAVNFGLLVLDAALFAVLFKVLRARFLDARSRVVSRR